MGSTCVAIGLMSGTSADGIDVACLRTDGEGQIQAMAACTVPYADDFRQQLIHAASTAISLDQVLKLERKLTLLHGQAVEQLCDESGIQLSEVDIIGFHGHTIRHDPSIGITHQIGNGPLLAELTGRPVVFDFRKADVAAGGQGAPLAALYHAAILGHAPRPALFLNVGGVANITWINETSGVSEEPEILAGDTGPGCGLLDALTQRATGRPFDKDGALALSGKINEPTVLSAMESNPFFAKPLPKSADRYEFTSIDVSHLWYGDAAATLCAITAEAIVRAVEKLPRRPSSSWITGGGAKHPMLFGLLQARLPDLQHSESLGHGGDFLEAACFAWLAVRHQRRLPTSVPGTTGVSRPICGGTLTLPQG